MLRKRGLTMAMLIALTSPALANPWQVDFTQPSNAFLPPIHVAFDTPTFLLEDNGVNSFLVNTGGILKSFGYNLSVSAGSVCSASFSGATIARAGQCVAFIAESSGTFALDDDALNATTNPLVWTGRTLSGTLTFTDLATAVPEPASLPVLALGLAGLGMVLRMRRA
jgi:hypothetical protein